MMNKNEVTRKLPWYEFAPGTYEIDEFDCASIFLLVGEKRAFVLDTGAGIGDLKGLIESLTDKPYDVVISHTLVQIDKVLAGSWSFNAESAADLLNMRLDSMNLRTVTADEIRMCKDSDDEVKRVHGIPYDNTYVKEICGVKHYVGEFMNERGEAMLRIISIDNHWHWPPATMPELYWEFITKFARNPQSGELIRL